MLNSDYNFLSGQLLFFGGNGGGRPCPYFEVCPGGRRVSCQRSSGGGAGVRTAANHGPSQKAGDGAERVPDFHRHAYQPLHHGTLLRRSWPCQQFRRSGLPVLYPIRTHQTKISTQKETGTGHRPGRNRADQWRGMQQGSDRADPAHKLGGSGSS